MRLETLRVIRDVMKDAIGPRRRGDVSPSSDAQKSLYKILASCEIEISRMENDLKRESQATAQSSALPSENC